jgi:hypothetical protein
MNKLLLQLIKFFTDDNLKFRGCIGRSFLVTVTSALLLGAATAQAATLTVTSSGDSGAGTLRQTILDASVSGGDTINFAVSGVITLTSGELPIAKNLTISGPGANVLTVRRSTAGGTPEFRIFFIGNSADVTISNLTIRNGRSYNSGGIYNNGATLTLNNCVLTANSAGGYGGGSIMNDGSYANASLKVNNCVFVASTTGTSIENPLALRKRRATAPLNPTPRDQSAQTELALSPKPGTLVNRYRTFPPEQRQRCCSHHARSQCNYPVAASQ